MTERVQKLYLKMIEFDQGDAGLIQHFTKVHAYCRLIALREGMDPAKEETLEAAALVHDIAIPLCRKKYGSSAGNLQEQEGPALVREMLPPLGFDEAQVERVSWLVAHHHTYSNIDTLDYQILVEADFLVNAFESNYTEQAKRNTYENIFKTETGKMIFAQMFGL